jgi:hypothetical protein
MHKGLSKALQTHGWKVESRERDVNFPPAEETVKSRGTREGQRAQPLTEFSHCRC